MCSGGRFDLDADLVVGFAGLGGWVGLGEEWFFYCCYYY